MQTDMSNERIKIQERILNDVIADVQLKLSRIEGYYQAPQSWYRSPNGRIILLYKEDTRIFFFNIYSAVDTLIHRYNLVSKYKFIYNFNFSKNKKNQIFVSEERDIGQEVVKVCDILLQKGERELTSTLKREIYKAIHKANRQHTLNYDKFVFIQNTLVKHYENLYNDSVINLIKKRIKRIIQFFEIMTYSDYIDLH